MRVIIVMAMQTTLIDQLHVLLKPSIGLGPRVPPVANYPNCFIIYCKKHNTGGYHISHKPTNQVTSNLFLMTFHKGKTDMPGESWLKQNIQLVA